MVELQSSIAAVSISPTTWLMTLEFAWICGWVPEGTIREQPLPGDIGQQIWRSDYSSSDGQTIAMTDGHALGEALERGLLEGPRLVQSWVGQRGEDELRTPVSSFRWFSTPAGQEYLRHVREICHAGAFSIH